MNSGDKAGLKRGGREARGEDGLAQTSRSPVRLRGLRELRVKRFEKYRSGGFALVITIILLALLVLVIYGLSALARVGSDIAASDGYQAQARQHALLGLSQAVGNLQRDAGDDAVLTGMAGIAGVPEGLGQASRHCCGVWQGTHFVRWFVSGEPAAVSPAPNGPDSVALVSAGSLGAEASDREYVRVSVVPVIVATREGGARRLGGFAWWVGDEGVKLSAVLPDERHAIDELVALSPTAPALANAVSYEQLALVPSTVTATALAGQLRANFHALGRAHLPASATSRAGLLNVNSTALRYWRGVAATYNRLKPAAAPSLDATAFATWMRDHVATADAPAGKAAHVPYASPGQFLNGDILATALDRSGGRVSDFATVMRPWLAVRSDTFRVRAYGDAVNPSDPARTESTAWCEAIVQRIKDEPTATRGRFVIIAFRWLGPDDI